MKTHSIIKCMDVILITASVGLAQTPVVETFDYEPGLLAGNGVAENGWGGPWVVFEGPEENMNIVEGPLDYPGLGELGNFLEGESPSSGCRAARPLETLWPDEAGNEYWLSFLMEIDNPAIVNNSWQGVSFFLLDTTGNYIERAYWGKNWGNEYWGFIGDFGALNYPSIYSSYDGIAWLVGKIVMSGDEQSERAYVWVHPDPSVEPDTLEASAAGFTQMSEGFNQVVCHLGMTEGIFCWYDEVRVGTCFADVTPAMTSVPKRDNEFPTRFELSQNYPNPFNPTTTISFNLPKSENITLKIYNLAGQEIETLVNGFFTSGTHKVQWNASGQPSGIYFYNLQAGDYTATKKLILQK